VAATLPIARPSAIVASHLDFSRWREIIAWHLYEIKERGQKTIPTQRDQYDHAAAMVEQSWFWPKELARDSMTRQSFRDRLDMPAK
jgi:hypothetical protein